MSAPESSDGAILAVNAGSSSLKFALFEAGAVGPDAGASGPEGKAVLRGVIEDIAKAPHLLARDAGGAVVADRRWPEGETPEFAALVEAMLTLVEGGPGGADLAAVGHRVVHGGADHVAPERVTAALLDALHALTPLDPLHLPHGLAPIHAIAAARPNCPQVACYDTAFHHDMPPVATRCAVPRALWAAGVRRYGFHGLSYEYIADCLKRGAPALAAGRVIVAHLGSGASLCAMRDGRSVATTMGFSVLDGLMMATRCGALDPGVILYLGRQGHSFAHIEKMLYEQSGLLGVSEISGDVRVLLASDDPRAAEAVELYSYRIAMEVGALVSALGGLDGLVFTAGVGEHAPAIRAAVCERLGWLGVRLDLAANEAGLSGVGGPKSSVDVRVITTDEEAMIARHTRAVLGSQVAEWRFDRPFNRRGVLPT